MTTSMLNTSKAKTSTANPKTVNPSTNGQGLISIIRDKFLVDAKGLNKIKGTPFASSEIFKKVQELIENTISEI